MNTKTVTAGGMLLAAAVSIVVLAGGMDAEAAKAPERHVMAVPYNNPAEARRAGFPANALNINRTADGTLSWMMTPQEIQRERNFQRLYLGPAQKKVAASITDGASKTTSASLFGVADTSTTTITGSDLQPDNQATLFNRNVFAGTLNCPTTEGADEYGAEVSLPSGALITGIRAYGSDTSAPDDPDFYVYQICNSGSGPAGNIVGSASVTGGFTGGNYAVNSGLLNHTVDNSDCSYMVVADTSEAACDGGNTVHMIALRWKRQISPDPATTTFTDVPLSHPFHREIEALVSSGVTGGCGSGNFCPNANVTRGQMAAFLSRALGLHWTDN